MPGFPGAADLEQATGELAAELPEPLVPLARIAYDYRWSWSTDGPVVFAAPDAERWERVGHNPVRLLAEAPKALLGRAALHPETLGRIKRLTALYDAESDREWRSGSVSPERPIAFLCAEYGVHESLQIYAGGLGVLAGDVCKQASDLKIAMVAVGLMYHDGYLHQSVDRSGYQHEYWIDTDLDQLPCALVTASGGHPLTVTVPLGHEVLTAQVWRAAIGQVPLYLLDADVPANSDVGRWVTSRLYDGNRAIRLAQYALLGVGAVRALRAMGIEPGVYHFNEGHPALAFFELVSAELEAGRTLEQAVASVRNQVVFTTHTPVPAGNETYGGDEVLGLLGPLADSVGDREWFLGRGRVRRDDAGEPVGMTVVAMRAARSTNAVSRRHEEVARQMWGDLTGSGEAPPITHVTNGVHLPTWTAPPMQRLLDHHLGAGWETGDASAWDRLEAVPDAELWAVRCRQRAHLVDLVRHRGATDRLRRGEDLSRVEAAATGLSPQRLTVGFARRIATYKRLNLIVMDPDRALSLLGGSSPLQFVFAGKAHPQDEEAKRTLQEVFRFKGGPDVGRHVVFLEDYDLDLARELVAGCDVWVNLPRPPQEASGTSGMKSCVNGGLQLSVLDGWWAEAYDAANGWAIEGSVSDDWDAQDSAHSRRMFDLLESEVVPLFSERGPDGVPVRWVEMIKRSMRSNCGAFSAARAVEEYAARIWRLP